MSFSGFRTSEEYQDARAEAARDAYFDGVEDHGWTCSDCAEMWDPGHVGATRYQPAEVRQDSCPNCGGDPVSDKDGCAIAGVIEKEDDDE